MPKRDGLLVRLPDKKIETINVTENDTIWTTKINIYYATDILPFKQQLFYPNDPKELEDYPRVKDCKELKQLRDEKKAIILREKSDDKKKIKKKRRNNDKVRMVRGKKFRENVAPSICFASGRGLYRAVKDLDCEFSIYGVNKEYQPIVPKDGGAFEVEITSVENPAILYPVRFVEKSDKSSIHVKWVPPEAGTYSISIRVADCPIYGSPFKVTSIDHENNGVSVKKMAYDKDWNVEAAKILSEWSTSEKYDNIIFNDIKMDTIFHLMKSEPQRLIQPLIGATLNRLLLKDTAKKEIFNGGISMIYEMAELNKTTKSDIISRYISRSLASIGHFITSSYHLIDYASDSQSTNRLLFELFNSCHTKLFTLFGDILDSTEDVETIRNIARALASFSTSNIFLLQMGGLFPQVVGMFENTETDLATRRYASITISNFTGPEVDKALQAKFFTSARLSALISALEHPSTEDTIVTESIRALANLSGSSTFAEMIISTHANGVARVINSISGTDSLTDWEIEATVSTYLPSVVDPVLYKQQFLSSYNRDDTFNYESVRLLSNLLTNTNDNSFVYKLAANIGVIRNLVQFLKSLNLQLQFIAIKVISALSSYPDCRNQIISIGGLPGLCAALNTCSSEGTPYIVAVLAQMPLNVTGALVNIIGDAGIHKLVTLLKLSDKQLQKDTAILLASMAGNEQFSKVVKAGGAQFLRSLIALVKSRKVHVQNNIDPNQIRFDKIIGQGISGVVWRATWKNNIVAVKRFDEESIAFSEDEFQSEVALMSIFRHENIVHCMGSCMEAGNLFIVCEIFERGNLEGIIHDHSVPMSMQLIVHLALGSAKGMKYLHTLGIIHRDLKTGNILVTNDWTAKVADFGLSRITDKLMTRGVGTPIYTSPEALAGRSYTLKADVYSFAFVLWELVTRKIPFAELPPFEAAIKASSENLRPEIPNNCIFEGLIVRCWDPDPAKRPDFTEIVDALSDIQLLIGVYHTAPISLSMSLSNNNDEDEEVEDQQYNYEKAAEILNKTLRKRNDSHRTSSPVSILLSSNPLNNSNSSGVLSNYGSNLAPVKSGHHRSHSSDQRPSGHSRKRSDIKGEEYKRLLDELNNNDNHNNSNNSNSNIEPKRLKRVEHQRRLKDSGTFTSVTLCAKCNKIVDNILDMVKNKDKVYHKTCFNCTHCKIQLTGSWCTAGDGSPYCHNDYSLLFVPKCQKCKKDITTEYVSVGNRDWHYECFLCTFCNAQLGNSFDEINEKPVCENCYNQNPVDVDCDLSVCLFCKNSLESSLVVFWRLEESRAKLFEQYKVIFLGNVDVGKTSTIIRFSEDKFVENNKGEEIDQITKDVQIEDQTVTISVTDTAGQERFHTLTSSYYRNADVIIVVYDMTNEDSFKDVEGFYVEGNRYSPRSLKYLVANKNDLDEERTVTIEQGEHLAEKLGIKYMETSAKTGNNVKELFHSIAKDLQSWGGSNTNESKNGVVLISGEPPKKEKKKCAI